MDAETAGILGKLIGAGLATIGVDPLPPHITLLPEQIGRAHV